jgi:glutathione S-transferase
MNLELVSFKLCPFVQRLVITMNLNNIKHDVTYINLQDPPAWFEEISPMGKVPLLKVDDAVLFESAVINEFLNDISSGDLLASNPLQRAQQRAWIEYLSGLNMDFFNLTGAKTHQHAVPILASIREKLGRLEQAIHGETWFGTALSLVDISLAPFLYRMALVADKSGDVIAEFPRVAHLSDNLLPLEAVQQSVTDDFGALFSGMLKNRGFLTAA